MSRLTDLVEAAYAAGANAYLVKPSSLRELRAALAKAVRFWLETNLTPGR